MAARLGISTERSNLTSHRSQTVANGVAQCIGPCLGIRRHAECKLQYADSVWNLQPQLALATVDLTAPSCHAIARFSFTYEGTIRSHMIVKGANHEISWYSITSAD